MNTKHTILILLTSLFMSVPLSVSAQSEEEKIRESEQAAYEAELREYEALIEKAELQRQQARTEASEAREAAELARRAAEEARADREMERQNQEEERVLREREVQIEVEELERMREELSRTHRELRETTRQVAEAHRKVVMKTKPVHRVSLLNLGDRAVIGVVLGNQTEGGVEIIGVSPDGPAERGGMEIGDVMTSIGNVDLGALPQRSGRREIYRFMEEVEEGEEISVGILREGDEQQLTLVAERREPTAWQSVIRIPEVIEIPGVPGADSGFVTEIVIPEIDEEALVAELAELEKKVEIIEHEFINSDHYKSLMNQDWEFEFHEFSDLSQQVFNEANVWFGLPHALGLELVTLNPQLGAYFGADSGVLVVQAEEDNDLQLQSGDVILAINSETIESPSDLMRAIREAESGDSVDVTIRRDQKDVMLDVVIPDNRFGLRIETHRADRH